MYPLALPGLGERGRDRWAPFTLPHSVDREKWTLRSRTAWEKHKTMQKPRLLLLCPARIKWQGRLGDNRNLHQQESEFLTRERKTPRPLIPRLRIQHLWLWERLTGNYVKWNTTEDGDPILKTGDCTEVTKCSVLLGFYNSSSQTSPSWQKIRRSFSGD